MALEELNDSTTLPRFTGSNPARWLCDLERFFSLYSIYEEDQFAYVVEYFDDEPFSWFNSWYRGHDHLTWKSFTTAMLSTFPPVPNPPQHEISRNNPKNSHAPPPTSNRAPVSKQTPILTFSLKPFTSPQSVLAENEQINNYYPNRHLHSVVKGVIGTTSPTHAKTKSYQKAILLPASTILGGIFKWAAEIRKWRPPWRAFETAPNAVGRVEWRPPWQLPLRLAVTTPNAFGRVEWRPPWTFIPSLRTRTIFRAGVLIRPVTRPGRPVNNPGAVDLVNKSSA